MKARLQLLRICGVRSAEGGVRSAEPATLAPQANCGVRSAEKTEKNCGVRRQIMSAKKAANFGFRNLIRNCCDFCVILN